MPLSKLLHAVLSPYEELSPEHKKYLEQICQNSHAKFIAEVKKQRGNRLKANDLTFSGEVFNGQEALQQGLIDEVGSLVQVLSTRHPGAKLEL